LPLALSRALFFGALFACGCADLGAGFESGTPQRYASPYALSEPDRARECAWFGSTDGRILYFGESPFWSAFQAAGGDPVATLSLVGPMRIGRFDLRDRRFLEPVVVAEEARGGVWDVLAHPNGRIYYTNLFGESGYYDPISRRSVSLPEAGAGLNELAEGPGGGVVVSRYGSPGQPGSVVVLDADGNVVRETPLSHPSGRQVAPKTVAWDPIRDEIWVATDLLPEEAGPEGHPLMVVTRDGSQRLEAPGVEVNFIRFTPEGIGYFAVAHGRRLELWTLSPGRGAASVPANLDTARKRMLAANFASALDFVQDIQLGPDRLVITRWSGILHVLPGEGPATTLELPRYEEGGLYYSGVGRGDTVCSTYCAGLDVVCSRVGRGPGLR